MGLSIKEAYGEKEEKKTQEEQPVSEYMTLVAYVADFLAATIHESADKIAAAILTNNMFSNQCSWEGIEKVYQQSLKIVQYGDEGDEDEKNLQEEQEGKD